MSALARPWWAATALLLVYLVLGLAVHPDAALGSDTGAKLATLASMDARGDLSVDVGYWAAATDPDATAHPLWQTERVGERFVAVTTLPMLLAAAPLHAVGGTRLALVLPALGGVAVALAAAALARRLGSRTPMRSFWIVGLASPVTVYALDLWEHALGLALMAWAAVLLLDLGAGRAGWRAAAGAGLLWGAAATMRTEALVYGAVATAAALVVLAAARRPPRVLAAAAGAALAGVALPLVANQALERAVLGAPLRSGRASGTAGAGGSEVALRAREALETSVGLGFGDPVLGRGGGLLAVALAAVGVLSVAAGGERARAGRWALASAAAILGLRILAGLSFVPGLLVATPFAVVGLVLAWQRAEWRVVVATALGALPLVWWFQYTGGASPQWAGRYVLLTGLVLGVVGIVAAEQLLPRRALVGFTVAALAVTALGASWLAVRSHRVADAFSALAADETPLVSTRAFLLREGGASYDSDRPWLTAVPDDDEAWRAVVDTLDAQGIDRVRIVDGPGTADDPPAAPLPGWTRTGEQRIPWLLDDDLRVTTWSR